MCSCLHHRARGSTRGRIGGQPWGRGGHGGSGNNSVGPQGTCRQGHQDDRQRLTFTQREGKSISMTDGQPGAPLPFIWMGSAPARGQPAQAADQPRHCFPDFPARGEGGGPLEDGVLHIVDGLPTVSCWTRSWALVSHVCCSNSHRRCCCRSKCWAFAASSHISGAGQTRAGIHSSPDGFSG